MNDLNQMFFQECDDLLEQLSSGLNDLEAGAGDEETVNSMFRAVHSMKGGAGAFGLDQLVSFAHAFENVLDDIRSQRLLVGDNVVNLLLTASDHLADLVEAASQGTELPPEQGASILSDLKHVSNAANGTSGDEQETVEEVDEADFQPTFLAIDGDLPSLDDMAAPEADAPVTIRFKASQQLFCQRSRSRDPVPQPRNARHARNRGRSLRAHAPSRRPLVGPRAQLDADFHRRRFRRRGRHSRGLRIRRRTVRTRDFRSRDRPWRPAAPARAVRYPAVPRRHGPRHGHGICSRATHRRRSGARPIRCSGARHQRPPGRVPPRQFPHQHDPRRPGTGSTG